MLYVVCREFRREGLSELIRRITFNSRVFRVLVCMCARVRVACGYII